MHTQNSEFKKVTGKYAGEKLGMEAHARHLGIWEVEAG